MDMDDKVGGFGREPEALWLRCSGCGKCLAKARTLFERRRGGIALEGLYNQLRTDVPERAKL
jgi:hypothetical protein